MNFAILEEKAHALEAEDKQMSAALATAFDLVHKGMVGNINGVVILSLDGGELHIKIKYNKRRNRKRMPHRKLV